MGFLVLVAAGALLPEAPAPREPPPSPEPGHGNPLEVPRATLDAARGKVRDRLLSAVRRVIPCPNCRPGSFESPRRGQTGSAEPHDGDGLIGE